MNVAKVGDFDAAKILTEEMTEAGLHPRGTILFLCLIQQYCLEKLEAGHFWGLKVNSCTLNNLQMT